MVRTTTPLYEHDFDEMFQDWNLRLSLIEIIDSVTHRFPSLVMDLGPYRIDDGIQQIAFRVNPTGREYAFAYYDDEVNQSMTVEYCTKDEKGFWNLNHNDTRNTNYHYDPETAISPAVREYVCQAYKTGGWFGIHAREVSKEIDGILQYELCFVKSGRKRDSVNGSCTGFMVACTVLEIYSTMLELKMTNENQNHLIIDLNSYQTIASSENIQQSEYLHSVNQHPRESIDEIIRKVKLNEIEVYDNQCDMEDKDDDCLRNVMSEVSFPVDDGILSSEFIYYHRIQSDGIDFLIISMFSRGEYFHLFDISAVISISSLFVFFFLTCFGSWCVHSLLFLPLTRIVRNLEPMSKMEIEKVSTKHCSTFTEIRKIQIAINRCVKSLNQFRAFLPDFLLGEGREEEKEDDDDIMSTTPAKIQHVEFPPEKEEDVFPEEMLPEDHEEDLASQTSSSSSLTASTGSNCSSNYSSDGSRSGSRSGSGSLEEEKFGSEENYTEINYKTPEKNRGRYSIRRNSTTAVISPTPHLSKKFGRKFKLVSGTLFVLRFLQIEKFFRFSKGSVEVLSFFDKLYSFIRKQVSKKKKGLHGQSNRIFRMDMEGVLIYTHEPDFACRLSERIVSFLERSSATSTFQRTSSFFVLIHQSNRIYQGIIGTSNHKTQGVYEPSLRNLLRQTDEYISISSSKQQKSSQQQKEEEKEGEEEEKEGEEEEGEDDDDVDDEEEEEEEEQQQEPVFRIFLSEGAAQSVKNEFDICPFTLFEMESSLKHTTVTNSNNTTIMYELQVTEKLGVNKSEEWMYAHHKEKKIECTKKLEIAFAYFRNERYEDCRLYCLKVLSMFPDHQIALKLMGKLDKE